MGEWTGRFEDLPRYDGPFGDSIHPAVVTSIRVDGDTELLVHPIRVELFEPLADAMRNLDLVSSRRRSLRTLFGGHGRRRIDPAILDSYCKGFAYERLRRLDNGQGSWGRIARMGGLGLLAGGSIPFHDSITIHIRWDDPPPRRPRP